MGYTDIPLWLSLVFMLGGLAALAWSSDVFVDGAAALAKALGISPFIIGMVIIGFGTSAPELCVSTMAGLSDHANLSLGNAYGSCTFNIAVILGVAVLIFPLIVKPSITFIAGPGLALISVFSLWVVHDGVCSRTEAVIFLGAFALILPLYCWYDQKTKGGDDAETVRNAVDKTNAKWRNDPRYKAVVRRRMYVSLAKIVIGLGMLIGSAHLLVWGAVDFARLCHVSDLVIGLTIVAAGTSLPELASAVASARRGEHEFVLGNIVGSNLFNMLAVVGLATVISPITVHCPIHGISPYVLTRDLPLLVGLSLTITLFGINWKHPKWPGAVNRIEAVCWLLVFVGYTVIMFCQETASDVQCTCKEAGEVVQCNSH